LKLNLQTTGVVLAAAMILTGCEKSSSPKHAKSPQPIVSKDVVAPASEPRLIKSDYKPGELTTLCDAAIAKVQSRLDAIGSLKSEAATLDNTLLAFENAMADFSDESTPLTFMGYVSTDEAVSAEGSACEEKLGQFYVGVFTRRDIYDNVRTQTARTTAEQRLLSETIKGFEINGLKLSDAELEKVKALKSELSTKESKFSANLNSDATKVEFAQEELIGASPDFLNRLSKSPEGKYIVTTKSTDYLEVMQNVSVAETRHKMLLAYLNRAADANTKLLEEAVVLRAQIAKLLGYETWADYRTSNRMVENKKNALSFLNDLKGKLALRNQQDFAQLLKFKKELDPSATQLDQWDITYLSTQLQKRDYSLDTEKIREYFPADKVISGLFEVYSKLLGVKFVQVKDAKVWSPDVRLFEIHDPASDALIGYFYADFVPRQGKYGHAAAFPLISGHVLPDGSYTVPVASIVANFTPPSGDKPSLLTHDEVETLFHEFGHIMHQTLTRAPYASLSGTAVAQDFVEAPSQMLENWVWSPEVLNIISGHYKTGEKLPQEMLEKMLAARNFGQGLAYTKQLLYALFDMTIHTQTEAVDVTKTYDDLYREIMGQEPLAGGHFAASFGHMMGGYDAGYYGYLWSEVYAQDMFSQFPENDLMNQKVGARYRSVILERGGMQEAIDLLREFLGREPNAEAFFKKLGI
jgi:thimet oligopeptidase